MGNIEYSIKTGASVPSGSGFSSIPAADAGWIPAISVVLSNGESSIGPEDVSYGTNDARFFEEGAVFGAGAGGAEFELNVDTRIATAGQTVFTGLTVDATYALVFVDGVYQSGVTVDSPTSVTIPEALPAGTVVDFVTTAGGYYVGGRVKRDVRIATTNQQVFNALTINARYASVYVDGVYQDNFTTISATSISLADPVPLGTRVVFEEKTAGIADLSIVVPEGGTTGQALIKNSNTDYDYDWGTVAGGGVPTGGTTGQVLTKLSNTDGDADWQNVPATGSGDPFSVETQTASASQSVFVIGTDPNTVLVFQNGSHITESVTVVNPNQIVLGSPATAGDTLVFIQVGDSSPDSVTIGKEQDLNLILNSKQCFIPPPSSISDVIAVNATGTLLCGSKSSGEVYTSTNGGATWSLTASSGLPSEIGGLATDGSRIVAAGISGQISYSDDQGVTWTPVTPIAGVTFFESVTYDSDNGVFLAVSDGGVVAASADGSTWSSQLLDSGTVNFKDIHFANGLSVAVGDGGSTSNIWTSSDGATWSNATVTGVPGPITAVYYGGSRWFAVADANIATSLDASSWASAQVLSESGTGAFYIDGVYFAFCENNVTYASIDQTATWTRYIIPGHVPSDYFSCAASSGNSTVFLGSFEMTRQLSKISRGL